jgi:hypothetical protein
MKLTVIVPDNLVIINGVSKIVDVSFLPQDIHAFQWHGQYGVGEIEYKYYFLTQFKKPNEIVKELGIFQQVVDAYNAKQE